MASGFFNPSQRGQLYTTDALTKLGNCTGERAKLDAFRKVERLDSLSQSQYSDLNVYMPGDILVKVDRASMLASLEVRCPLLDHVVFEFMAKVPANYKMNLRDSKVLLKKAVGPLLPPAIHTRNKQGFGIPLAEWLRGPFQIMLHDTLLDGHARARGLFNSNVVQRLIDEHSRGSDHKEKLWALLCFELWAREYLDN
jgi:asparagine synthase (glutamine-hydrolysing)